MTTARTNAVCVICAALVGVLLVEHQAALVEAVGITIACTALFMALRRRRFTRREKIALDRPAVLLHELALIWALRLFLPLFAWAVPGQHHKFVYLLLLISVTPLLLILAGRASFHSRPSWPLVLFVVLTLVAWGRAHDRSSLLIGASALALLTAIWLTPRTQLPNIVDAIVDSCIAELLLNIAGHFAGIATSSTWSSGGDAALGGRRVFFPYSFGLNTISAVGAVVIVAWLASTVKRPRIARLWRFVGLVSGIYVIVAASSRVPALVTVVIGAAMFFRPNIVGRKFARILVVAMLFLPAWWGIARASARPAAGALGSAHVLSRGSTTDELLSLQGRVGVWRAVSDGFPHFPVAKQAVGWGAKGQVSSGLYHGFGAALPGFVADPRTLSSHSSYLQVLVDEGVLGVAVLLAMVWVPLRRLARDTAAPTEVLTLRAMICVVAVCAATESFLSPTVTQEPFWLMVFLVGVASMATTVAKRDSPILRVKVSAPVH